MHASHTATKPTPPPIAVPVRIGRKSDAASLSAQSRWSAARTILQADYVLRQVLEAVEHQRKLHGTLVIAVLDGRTSCSLRLGGFGHGCCLPGAQNGSAQARGCCSAHGDARTR